MAKTVEPRAGSACGVCFLGEGTPLHAAEVRPYLCRVYADRYHRGSVASTVPGVRRLAARMLARRFAPDLEVKYRLLGKRSPHLAQTSKQAAAIGAELDRRGLRIPVFPAMRYTSPTIEQVVDQLRYRGVSTIIGLSQHPHYSREIGASAFAALDAACARAGIGTVPIRSYPEAPGLVEAWREALEARLPPKWDRAYAHVLFVARSVPRRRATKTDFYLDEVHRTAIAVAAALPSPLNWSLAFQSPVGRGRWLGPGAEAAVIHEVNRGCRHLIVVPIGSLAEDVDTLYHLDACLPQLAVRAGPVTFARIPVPALAPVLIRALADLVQDRVAALTGR